MRILQVASSLQLPGISMPVIDSLDPVTNLRNCFSESPDLFARGTE